MLGKIEGRRRRGVTEDEMVGWHHQINGHDAAAAKLLQSSLTLYDAIDGSPQGSPAPPSLGFSRLEHSSGLPFPSPMHEK